MKNDNYTVGINVQSDNLGVRYLQIGMEIKGKFTGKVVDYAGGGEYQTFYWLNGKEISDLDGESDYDQMEEKVTKKYPGLVDTINQLECQYITYDDMGFPVAKRKLLVGLKKTEPGYLFNAGAPLKAVTCSCGLTIFPDSGDFHKTIEYAGN